MDINTERSPRVRTTEVALEILREGEVEVRGLFRLGSNDTFLCQVQSPSGTLPAVYKPVRGERPLWDFPAGSLAKREVAAFEVSRLLGWEFVPPTVFRDDGPLGPGSFQEFLDLDLEQNYFILRDRDSDALRRVAAFDIIINNADRKAMHVLRDTRGTIWLIDHGVCFHREWKLRTVVWDFADEALPDEIILVLEKFTESKRGIHHSSRSVFSKRLQEALSPLLAIEEIRAMESRAEALRKARKFPVPGPGRSVPWPVWA